MRRNGRRVARRRRSPGRSHHDADQRRSLIHPPIAPSRHRAIASSRHRVIAPLIARLFDTSTLVEAIHRHRHGTSRPTRCTRTQWGVLSTPWAARASRAAPACRQQPRAGCVGTGCRPGSGRQPPRPPRRSRRADLKWKWPITKHKQPHSLFPILCARHAAISKAYTSSSCTVRLMTLWTLLQVRWTTPIRQPIDRSLSHLPSPPIPSAGLSARLQRRRRPQREARPQ